MKTIKFRIWDNCQKKFLDDPAIYISRDGYPHIFDSRGIPKPYPRMVSYGELWFVQFYIGVKDKNGREIYEGDILKVYFVSMGAVAVLKDSQPYFEIGEVFYDQPCCAFRAKFNLNLDDKKKSSRL